MLHIIVLSSHLVYILRTKLKLLYVFTGTSVRARFGGMLSTGTASASEKKTTFRSLRTRAVPVGVTPLRSPGLVSSLLEMCCLLSSFDNSNYNKCYLDKSIPILVTSTSKSYHISFLKLHAT